MKPVDVIDASQQARASYGSAMVAVAALTAVGAFLRFTGLDYRDFWFDESCTFIYVHNLFNWPAGSNLLVESTNLPYYFVLRGWVGLFGDTETAYRSLSALTATLTIPLLSLVAGRLGGRMSAIVCAAIVAFHPLHIHYAHEARAYAMWVLLLSAALWLLVEASRRLRPAWWIAYGSVLLCCLHLHYFTVYWLPSTILCIWLAADRRRALRQWVCTHLVVGVLFVPYLFAAVLPAGRGGGSAWIGSIWEPLTAIPRTLWAFLPAGGYPQHLRGLSILSPDTVRLGPEWLTAGARVIPLLIFLAMTFGLLRATVARSEADGEENLRRSPYAVVLGMTLVPLILAWMYSLIVRPNYMVGRYDLVAWPAFMVGLAMCVSAFARRTTSKPRSWIAIAVCVPMLGCSLVPIARMAALKPASTFHNLRAQEIARIAGADDLVIAFTYDRDYLLYYLHRHGFSGRILSYPSWLDSQIGWVDTSADLAGGAKTALLAADAAERIGDVESTISRGGRVWLLFDSMARRGSSPRVIINERLFEALSKAGYRVDIVDVELLIFSVERQSS